MSKMQQNEQNNTVAVDEELIKQFSQTQNKNEIAEVLHELFDKGKIYMIGDLTKDEIKLATRIYMVSKIKNIEVWQEGLAFFCMIMLSKERKSRKELIHAITGLQQNQNFMQKMFSPINK